ncbi:MAG: Dihydrolipoyllysine-residue acetyltransferase component of pyruvate dehydrogenase complex [Alphaproteobacteria bacterium MarineAlpha2_Bin1]|nr:MAG: Dihydrolipoyllysine-residue acetyltransferase component of pyruvate dehydrogenase complex [Alphaproteobacteria bacterium MarineAlpha2_Bin1]|tara:strand:+ start:630 stop:1934 length:1305 start_codon:yes stop_codon:yes gene_type:complete
MPISIKMPALSPTMEEGSLSKWLVREGDKVLAGDVIAEVETDKATMEVEAVEDGIFSKILVSEGTQSVPVNKVIALMLEEGEDQDSIEEFYLSNSKDENIKPENKEFKETKKAVNQIPELEKTIYPSNNKKELPAKVVQIDQGLNKTIASPLARRMAKQASLDLNLISGSGPRGRIIKNDILAYIDKSDNAKEVNNINKNFIKSSENYTEIPNSNMRKIIAQRLTQSKQEVPHFYLTVDCVINELLSLRKELNNRSKDGKFKLSINDFVISAVAQSLAKVPETNASWSEKSIIQYKNIDISIAVALEDGLITPVIRDANHKGLAEISNEMKDLIHKANNNKLMPEDYKGGTFSISNLGMYGIKEFSAVINPPQGAILAVGKGEERAVVIDGALSVANVMTCTLSCDHRVVDGAVGSKFLTQFKEFIEDPVSMML